MPLPKQFRPHIPNVAPSSVAQHTENILTIGKGFADLPFFPVYDANWFPRTTIDPVNGTPPPAVLVVDRRSVTPPAIPPPFIITKRYDGTDLYVSYGMCATTSAIASTIAAKLILTNLVTGMTHEPTDDVGYLPMDVVGRTRLTSTRFTAIRGIPAGQYRVALRTRRAGGSGGPQIGTDCPQSLLITETIPAER